MTPSPQPAAKSKRRWFQFSLRTLLVGTAVVAAILAVGLRWIVPAQRQRAAVRLVESLGGTAKYAEWSTDDPFVVLMLREFLPRDYFDGVVYVNLESTNATDDVIDVLNGLTKLEGLDLKSTDVTDAGLLHLRKLRSLKFLTVSPTSETNREADLQKAMPNVSIDVYP